MFYFNGSLYDEVDDPEFTGRFIRPGKYITTYNGIPAVVQDGKLFVKVGDHETKGPIDWDRTTSNWKPGPNTKTWPWR